MDHWVRTLTHILHCMFSTGLVVRMVGTEVTFFLFFEKAHIKMTKALHQKRPEHSGHWKEAPPGAQLQKPSILTTFTIICVKITVLQNDMNEKSKSSTAKAGRSRSRYIQTHVNNSKFDETQRRKSYRKGSIAPPRLQTALQMANFS